MLVSKKLANAIRGQREICDFTQSELGEFVGVTQAAISQIEQGKPALSPDKLLLVLEKLNLPASLATSDEETKTVLGTVLAACPNPECPAALQRSATRGLCARPKFFLIPSGDIRHCSSCGTALIDQCQNPSCREPLQDGDLHCTACGKPYAAMSSDGSRDLVKLRRTLIAQHREFSQPAPPPHRLPPRKKTRLRAATQNPKGFSENE